MKNNLEAKVTISDLNLRKGPGKKYDRLKFVKPGTYVITEVVKTDDSKKGYGKLEDGSGWISLDFAEVNEQHKAKTPAKENSAE